jgi:hypothetical protein
MGNLTSNPYNFEFTARVFFVNLPVWGYPVEMKKTRTKLLLPLFRGIFRALNWNSVKGAAKPTFHAIFPAANCFFPNQSFGEYYSENYKQNIFLRNYFPFFGRWFLYKLLGR